MYQDLLRWLAIIPGIILIVQVYRQDKIEKEPIGLLVKCLILGALTVISAIALETLGEYIIEGIFEYPSRFTVALDCFLVVALAEEGGKYFVLKLGTWKHKAFNFRFDGIVYAVCVSMGFAIVENIFYVIDGGVTTALMRALTAVPGHCIFAVFMGHFYGEAKVCEARGNIKGMDRYQRLALWVPVLIHGFYDFCLSVETISATLTFFVFIIGLDVFAIHKIKQYSMEDMPIYSPYNGPWGSDF